MNHEKEEHSFEPKRAVLKEIEYPTHWTKELLEKFINTIPESIEISKEESPVYPLDLSTEGFGVVYIKNEAEKKINPTGTIKDRLGRACAGAYRSMALEKLQLLLAGSQFFSGQLIIPRYSIITAGNTGRALAHTFEQYNLPPPKLLLDKRTPAHVLEILKNIRADIYSTDLNINTFSGEKATDDPYSPRQILELTNNQGGYDLTSANMLEDPHKPFPMSYYSFAREIFARRPDEVYIPYGSGMVFEGIITMQYIDAWKTDAPANKLNDDIVNIKILGAEPETYPSIADKLAAPVKPFINVTKENLENLKQGGFTNPETGVYQISESDIQEAFQLLITHGRTLNIETEPSAAAGLALYMRRWKKGLVDKAKNILIINTGSGPF